MCAVVPIVGGHHIVLAARPERGSGTQVKRVIYRNPQRAGQQVSFGSRFNTLPLLFVVPLFIALNSASVAEQSSSVQGQIGSCA
jgi:hypothetical protein